MEQLQPQEQHQLAQDARKPIFHLRPADGAIGAHMDAVQRCRTDFENLSQAILTRTDALLNAKREK